MPSTRIMVQGKPIALGNDVDVVLLFLRDAQVSRYALDGIDWVKGRHAKHVEFEAVVGP